MRWLVGLGLAFLALGGSDGGGVPIDPPAHLPRPSRHFTWGDLTRSTAASDRRIDNRPVSVAHYQALAMGAQQILDPLVDRLPYRVFVSSGYRNPTVNKAVGGYKRSDHMTGRGLDLILYRSDGTPLTSAQAARAILNANVPVDTLIWYGSDDHVHISWGGGIGRGRVQYAASHGATPVDRMPA